MGMKVYTKLDEKGQLAGLRRLEQMTIVLETGTTIRIDDYLGEQIQITKTHEAGTASGQLKIEPRMSNVILLK